MAGRMINPHPGEVLLEEFVKPLGISQNRLTMEICVPCHRINELVHGRRGVTADTALRLGRFLGTTAEFWMNLQKSYDLAAASESLAGELAKIHALAPQAAV